MIRTSTLGAALLITLTVGNVPAQAAPKTLKPARDLLIDANRSNLSAVGDLAVSASGHVAVSQYQDEAVRIFDATGKSLGTFGRPGEGPGEFRNLHWIGWRGDTLVVADNRLRRITFVSPTLHLIRSVSYPTQLLAPMAASGNLHLGGGIQPWALFADNSMLMVGTLINPSPTFAERARAGKPIMRVTSNGSMLRLLAWNPRFPAACLTADGNLIPLCATGGYDHSPSGAYVAVYSAPFPTASGKAYRLTLITGSGDTVYTRTFPWLSNPVPRRVIDSIRARAMRLNPAAASMLRSMSIGTVYPPIKQLMVADDGTVWIEHWSNSPGTTWEILGPSGQLVGQVVLPAHFTVMVVQRAGVHGVAQDADGSELIVHYSIRVSQ